MRRQAARDDMNSFAVAELLKEWVASSCAISSAAPPRVAHDAPAKEWTSDDLSDPLGEAGEAVDTGLTAGGVGGWAAGTAARWAVTTTTAQGLPAAAAAAVAATQVIGVASALVATGTAIRGWTSLKFGQTAVRTRISDLSQRIR